MNINSWLSPITAARATSLAPTFGDGMGHVRPQHVDANTTHAGSAWRPPIN